MEVTVFLSESSLCRCTVCMDGGEQGGGQRERKIPLDSIFYNKPEVSLVSNCRQVLRTKELLQLSSVLLLIQLRIFNIGCLEGLTCLLY